MTAAINAMQASSVTVKIFLNKSTVMPLREAQNMKRAREWQDEVTQIDGHLVDLRAQRARVTEAMAQSGLAPASGSVLAATHVEDSQPVSDGDGEAN